MVNRFLESLLSLLPPGMAFARHPKSVTFMSVKSFAASFAEHYEFTLSALSDALPHRTCERLGDWERSLSLPDCTANTSDFKTRRQHVINRLRLPYLVLPYVDSSPMSIKAQENLLAMYGVTATITMPSKGKLVVSIANNDVTCGYARAGIDRVGIRLYQCNDQNVRCILNKVLPAEFTFVVN